METSRTRRTRGCAELLTPPGPAPARVREGHRATIGGGSGRSSSPRPATSATTSGRNSSCSPTCWAFPCWWRRSTIGRHRPAKRAAVWGVVPPGQHHHGVHRARPVPREPSPRRALGDNIDLVGSGYALRGGGPGSRPTARRCQARNSTSGRPATRASTTCSSPTRRPGQRPRTVHRRRERRLLVPYGPAVPLHDPDRRPGRHAAARDQTARVPPGAHPLHRDRPGHHDLTTHIFVAGSRPSSRTRSSR